MTDTRAIVLEILIENEKNGTFLSGLIKDVLDKYSYLDRRDRAFIKTLAEGTAGNRIALDYCIDSVSSVQTAKMKPVIRAVIRMGAYQLKYMDHVPDSAVCNEAVKLVKLKHMDGLSGFVNGVLRSLAVDIHSIEFPDPETEFSCPRWIAGMFRRDHGREYAEMMIRSLSVFPQMYLRTNTCRCTPDELAAILEEEGVSAERAPFPDEALESAGDLVPSESSAFNKGLFSIQDISSMAAVKAADIKGSMNVIDLCAAPGGKCTFAAELMQGKGLVQAFDLSDDKVRRINENIARLGLENVKTEIHDAAVFDSALEGSADCVIADLPCSGLGVLRRKADIRYRVRYEDIASLQSLQRNILRNAVLYMKDGGTLLYSTCTVTREETAEQSDFLRQEYGLEMTAEKQFLQGIDPCDGFYYAVFRKNR